MALATWGSKQNADLDLGHCSPLMHGVTLGKLLNLCKLLFPLLSNFRTENYQIEKYLVFHLIQHVYFAHLEAED